MALELRQQMKMSQQLVMTPQLRQAIKLLQLSRLELLETVQQEMLENPFLEEASPELAMPDVAEFQSDTRAANGEEAYDREISNDASWEDYLGDFASTPRQAQQRDFETADELSPLEARCAAKPSLEGHLLWQLHLSPFNAKQKQIGEEIIGNLNSSGYLQASADEIATSLGVGVADVEFVLSKIQLFDPVGVAAPSARECLLIQLRHLQYDRDPILLELVQSHLEDLEAKRYKPLLRKFKIDIEVLKEYIDIIQSLEPFPGASFSEGDPIYVSPDVYVYKMGEGFVILLNDDGLPQLQLSEMSQMDLGNASDQEKDYCNEKIRSASWLIKSLYQRQRTLYKVTESIVNHQRAFFEEGVTKLAPLVLKDIADDIEMHESTVSRITTNKFVATPHGVFELKFFFNSALGLEDGSQVGSESVKALIKKFIAEENPSSPLSDEHIGELLKEHLKVNIARRTVAKYRTQLGIDSSSRRKAHF